MYIILGLVVIGVLIGIAWRLSSHRWILPCPAWLGWLVELDNPFSQTNRASVMMEHLNLKPGMVVLDAGCGPGRMTIPVAKALGPRGKVTAMDIQPGMLDRVREKAGIANLENIRFLQAKLGEGKLERSYYDRAVLATVLGEIPDQKSALKELFEALKPEGVLLIAETIFDPHFQRKKRVLQLAAEVGFQVKKCIGNRFDYTVLLEKPL